MEFLAIYRDYVTLDMIWLGVAVLALVVKCFTREYVSLCVAIGALAAFVGSVTIFHGHLLYQVITAVAVAFILAIFIQPYAMHKNQEQRMREAREKLIPHKDEEGIPTPCTRTRSNACARHVRNSSPTRMRRVS